MKKTNKNINRRINNVRGFTLIELLAVIVVLAVIMLIAVNAVIPQMNNARRQAFAIEANGLVDSAQAFVVTASITGSGA
ncbi:MAG: type II secretion system protein, partial [Bacilli bacterium]